MCICPYCGAQASEEDVFCRKCGFRLIAVDRFPSSKSTIELSPEGELILAEVIVKAGRDKRPYYCA